MRRLIPQGLWAFVSDSGRAGFSISVSGDTQGRTTYHGGSGRRSDSHTATRPCVAGRYRDAHSFTEELRA